MEMKKIGKRLINEIEYVFLTEAWARYYLVSSLFAKYIGVPKCTILPSADTSPVVINTCEGVINEFHFDVIKWKHFPSYWPFVRWVNNRDAGDLRRRRTHYYDVIVM